MTLSSAEPISPELALVCPELAQYARQRLPEHPWQLVNVKPTQPAGAPTAVEEALRLPQWAAVAAYVMIGIAARVVVAVVIGAAVVLALTLLPAWQPAP